MLTIRTPLKLTIDPSILTVSDNFGTRMIDNYNQISADIEAIDMMHFISASPEVYIGEGGMTSLIESKNLFENQEIKINVINSVLNRILASDSYYMTYQDTVFINNTLRKMGIENVQEFLKQVKELKEETKNVNELIDLYWSGGDVLEQYRTYMEQVNVNKNREAGQTNRENTYYLHQNIFNRLSTGAIYQELLNFVSNHYNHNSLITENEMQLSEQNMFASNVLLNKLKNYYSYEEAPLEYNRLNIYEFGDTTTNENSSQHIDNELISAVVLNALTQMYAARYMDIVSNDNVWFRLENVLYEVAYNTFERFNSYHNRLDISREVTNQYISMLKDYHEGEIKALTNLIEQGESNLTEVTTYLDNNVEQTSIDESTFEQAAQYMNNSQLLNYVNHVVQESNSHNQQIIKVTNQEKLMKQQLDFFNQQNLVRQQELITKIQNSEENVDQTTLANQILMEAISNPPEFSLEYLMSVNEEAISPAGAESVTTELSAEAVVNTIRRNDRRIRNIEEREFTQIELTHKTEETTISEELLEEIQNRVTVTNRNIENKVDTVNQTTQVQEIVTNQINQMQARTTHELEDMVSRNISSQLGNIYDQVYSKLEKKMESERRRRGL